MLRRACGVLGVALALAACERADVASAEQQPGRLDEAEALYQRAEFDSARVVWREGLAAPGIRGSPDEARIHTWLARAAYRLGEYAEARSMGERGLELALGLGLHREVAEARNALGLLAWAEGRLPDAAVLLAAALDGSAAAGDAAGVARASNNLGLVRHELGRFEAAREAFELARDTARALDDALIEGRVLTNLGMLEIWTGEPTEALAILESARARATEAGDVVGQANALGQMGVAHMILGAPGAALAVLDSALALAHANELRDEEANDLVVIAGIHADAGDAEQALRAYESARQINEELGLTIEAGTVLREEAVLRAARGATELARRDALEALRLHRDADARREEFLDLLVLADIDRRSGELVAATQRMADARRLVATLGSAQARLALALVDARIAGDRGDAERVLRILENAEPDLPYGGPAAVAESNALRLRAWRERGQLDSAAAAGRRAVAAIETVRDGFASGPLRTSYVADRSRVYADLVMVFLERNDTEQAFAVADAARGRAMLEHLGAAREGIRRRSAVRELADAERVLRRIDQLLSQLAREEARPPNERGAAYAEVSGELLRHLERARSEYGALLVRAAESEPDRARLMGARPASTEEVRTALAADEALLELLPTMDRLFVFVVTRDTVRVSVRTITQDALVHQVQLARELLMAPGTRGREKAVTSALHELLLAPALAVDTVAGARHLFIVPHGVLAYLPFAALRDEASGRLLVEARTISHLPAAGVLPLLRAGRSHSPRAGAVAFAPFPERLPSTAGEAAAFRRAVPGAASRVGRRATEGAVRKALDEGMLVHVATHGIMNARNPLFSRIELARGRTHSADDGRLEVHELLDMTIRSPLVFLSGCETALGGTWSTTFGQGEDYATLAQAFLLAGAGGVVATLWRIDDAGAAVFAARFYRHLQDQSPERALAAAQREMLADSAWRAPYYWAAYTLGGAGLPAAQTGWRGAVQ